MDATRPFFVIYVAWHPLFSNGQLLAKSLYDHYRRKLYDNIIGGAGLSVSYRFAPQAGSALPLDIDFADSETCAIVLLLDDHWAGDPNWVTWANDLLKRTNASGLGTRVFPVTIASESLALGMAEQAIRWDQWATATGETRMHQLISSLTYQFCRMLRFYLERLKRPLEEEEALLGYLRKVEVFLSHSKHDPDGVRIAQLIRRHLHQSNGFDSFFDVHDIPPGLPFHDVILLKVKVSAVVAIHTDSYSSREWCRREIIEAKRWSVPLVVANCISDVDERSFPYMGNVPVVRSAKRFFVAVPGATSTADQLTFSRYYIFAPSARAHITCRLATSNKNYFGLS
jgi:hypothetical protein